MPMYNESAVDSTFRSVCSGWLKKLENSKRHKNEVFTRDANECYRFYAGNRSWAHGIAGDVGGIDVADAAVDPTFKVSINKAAEYVALFGPSLYYQNPVRTVKPRQPIIVPPQFYAANPYLYQALIQKESARIQEEGLVAVLLESYLNWTPAEYHLDQHSKQGINEALVKGRGVLWTEVYTPPGSQVNSVRSVWDSVSHLYVDPDAGSYEDAMWVMRKRIKPTWEVERRRGLMTGSLKGNYESIDRHSDIEEDTDKLYKIQLGRTNDLIVYYELYSKMGCGGRLSGLSPRLREPLELLGDYVYLELAEGVPFPLNLPPNIVDDPGTTVEEIQERVAWPTPFWKAGLWPCSSLDFVRTFNCPWPRPPLKAGLGELKFLQWAYSFLLGHVRTSCRDFIAVLKSAAEEIKATIESGRDFEILEIDGQHKSISEIIQFLQHPPINGDIYKLCEMVERNFEKRVGLNDLMYGMPAESVDRSAAASNIRQSNTQIRPDDMRKQVDSWMSEVAFKEGLAARYHLTGVDVQGAIGEMGAQAWDQFVASRDLNIIATQLEYRVEAGSTARPNRQALVDEMNNAAQIMIPVFQGYAQTTGDFAPINAFLHDWAEAHDLDPNRYQMSYSGQPMQTSPDQAVSDPQKDVQYSEVS